MSMQGMQPPSPNARKQVRFGLMMAKIDTDHVVRNSDGIQRQFRVRDISRFPKAQTVCVCFFCRKSFRDEEELIASHPDEKVLRKQQEKHVYAFWSEDPLEPKAPVIDDKTGAKSKKEDASPTPQFDKIIGLLSNQE